MAGKKGQSGGHNRKTDREKELIGVTHKERMNQNAPDIIRKSIDFQGLGEKGLKFKEIFGPMLLNTGFMSATDSVAFHLICDTFEQWIEIREELKQRGRYIPIKDISGKTISVERSEWCKLEKEIKNDLWKYLADFGLNPMMRNKIVKFAQGEKINPFSGLTKDN